ncbi:MAG: hypothetical protein QNJ54_19155 [Prochloraceae cyanobacterium]|nr:hypothetical protein [Prochloraceae cyanobacterium]
MIIKKIPNRLLALGKLLKNKQNIDLDRQIHLAIEVLLTTFDKRLLAIESL